MRIVYAALFLITILAANYATSHLGLVPVGFGLVATAGTYLAGLSFVLRDAVQDTAGRTGALVVIVLGALLSFVVAAPVIALASGAAFLCSELADLAVYSPLRRSGYVRAALASNVVGALVDSLVFLSIAGFPLWASLPGQMLAKLTVTALAVALVLLARAGRTAATSG